jgi:hypothetical protein
VIASGNTLQADTSPPQWTAGVLASPMPTFSADMTCAEACDWFNENSTQAAAAVVDGANRVTGLVNRLRFLARYSRRYTPELYGKHSILKMANPKPLIVDEAVPVSDLAKTLVLEWPDALRECFVVTRSGHYLGIGTSEALVRCKLDILMARESELKDALMRATEASRKKTIFSRL